MKLYRRTVTISRLFDPASVAPAWRGARDMSRDVFRNKLLDPDASDETVDQLRRAAKGIVEGRTHEQLGVAGEALALAAFKTGLDAWPRSLTDSQQDGKAIVTANPRISRQMKASSVFDYETTIKKLRILHRAASTLGRWHKDQAEEFIDVVEYSLAHDGIACAYLNNTMCWIEFVPSE